MVSTLIVFLTVLLSADDHAARASVEARVQKILDALPGRKAFLFAELTAKGPVPLFASHADEKFAIGSGFKLFILGTLIDEVNQGQRRNDNVMILRRDLIGPPQSELADWPIGSPVTLYTLALKMISISDNTATDHLLFLLGRERIEKQMQEMGHSNPAVNRPFLFTREMAMLRDKRTPERQKTYRQLDEAGRRRYLKTHIAGLRDYEKLDFDTAAFDIAEWYATALDMARALDWIGRHAATDKPARLLREVLAVKPMLDHDAGTWPFVGFKGGSEDQLLAGNWLLRHKSGKWYTFHVFCHSKDKKLDRKEMTEKVQAIFAIIEKQAN
jgi:beta-lactamase class A